ncbi:hypothetical protein MXD61_06895 [Frankia sp. AgPm24]|uniref:hypothetical protein n=1 Tax=Frankia sp. AgPm24 TaxID=631128 RepID=UPI00200BE3DB|nr:hypothetical protein [Frankia sp. AgPm24]MCK9921618.1 hypothetical protein [Frankia sp. AgPm24]
MATDATGPGQPSDVPPAGGVLVYLEADQAHHAPLLLRMVVDAASAAGITISSAAMPVRL